MSVAAVQIACDMCGKRAPVAEGVTADAPAGWLRGSVDLTSTEERNPPRMASPSPFWGDLCDECQLQTVAQLVARLRKIQAERLGQVGA